jgi:hypothetical protein
MRFQQISETEYRCHSDSGQTYRLTGEPIPDEFESAMRCGIDPSDEFVQMIPLVWTCHCPAGQHGRDCKHIRALLRERGNNVPTEEEHAAQVARERADRSSKAAAAQAIVDQETARKAADRDAYEAARDNPECRQMAANLAAAHRAIYAAANSHAMARCIAEKNVLTAQFEERWGFTAYETRIRQLIQG